MSELQGKINGFVLNGALHEEAYGIRIGVEGSNRALGSCHS